MEQPLRRAYGEDAVRAMHGLRRPAQNPSKVLLKHQNLHINAHAKIVWAAKRPPRKAASENLKDAFV
jgi:hypothetical protein